MKNHQYLYLARGFPRIPILDLRNKMSDFLPDDTEIPTLRNVCSSCRKRTIHSVLSSHLEGDEEGFVDSSYQVIQCRGCNTFSFRKHTRYLYAATQIGDEGWDVPEDITTYPRVLEGHQELDESWRLPEIVQDIYIQSLQAIRDNSNTLAGIGLRATIEAICNDRSIVGRTLDKRIDTLAKTGLISQNDAHRLHSIRFLGNDAAHEIKRADSSQLMVALRIIEHLLVSIYILDEDASELDTIIKDFDSFKNLLEEKIENFGVGDELPLSKIFDKDARRLLNNLPELEKELISRIQRNEYERLAIGKLDNFAGSKEQLQHFIVQLHIEIEDAD